MTPGSAGTARGGQILRGEGLGVAAGGCQGWRETPGAVPWCWTSSPGPPPSLIRIPSPPTSLFPLLLGELWEGSRSIPGTSEGNSDLAEPPHHLQGLRWSPCHHHSRTPSPLPPPQALSAPPGPRPPAPARRCRHGWLRRFLGIGSCPSSSTGCRKEAATSGSHPASPALCGCFPAPGGSRRAAGAAVVAGLCPQPQAWLPHGKGCSPTLSLFVSLCPTARLSMSPPEAGGGPAAPKGPHKRVWSCHNPPTPGRLVPRGQETGNHNADVGVKIVYFQPYHIYIKKK